MKLLPIGNYRLPIYVTPKRSYKLTIGNRQLAISERSPTMHPAYAL